MFAGFLQADISIPRIQFELSCDDESESDDEVCGATSIEQPDRAACMRICITNALLVDTMLLQDDRLMNKYLQKMTPRTIANMTAA